MPSFLFRELLSTPHHVLDKDTRTLLLNQAMVPGAQAALKAQFAVIDAIEALDWRMYFLTAFIACLTAVIAADALIRIFHLHLGQG
jgi:hypothetical protein